MTRSAGTLGILLATASAGCGTADSWMPLETGRAWRYYVYDARGSKVVSLRVSGKSRVGTTEGYRLTTSSGGECRMAWSDGRLLISDLPAIRFDPPVPMLDPSAPTSGRRWSGTCLSRGFADRATAMIEQRPARLTVGGTERDTLLVTLEMTFRGQVLQVKTWFADGLGILRQEQSVDGKRLVALEWIGGS